MLFLFFPALFFQKANAQCTPRILPFTEDFSGTPLGTCTPTTGGWVSTSSASQADWWIPAPPTNYAGGAAPEIEAYGNQANGGISETITLTSPPINTTGFSSLTLSFKHNLYLDNSAASGSSAISIDVSISPDNLSWSSVYGNGYSATSTLTSVVTETRTIPLTGLNNTTTYVRFSISGVLFKVWGWEIDDVNMSAVTTDVAQSNEAGNVIAFPNPVKETLTINADGRQNNVAVFDFTGKMVYASQITGTQLTIDTKDFAQGLYSLRVQNEKGVFTKKIIKE